MEFSQKPSDISWYDKEDKIAKANKKVKDKKDAEDSAWLKEQINKME